MNRPLFLLLFLLVAAGALGYGFYQQRREQAQLNAQLYQLDEVLTADNEDDGRRADSAVKGIEADVVKNQNQPKEVAVLAAARNLHSAADSIAQTLCGLARELRRTSGNAPFPTLSHLGEVGEAEKVLRPAGAAQRGLQQQLASYRAAQQSLHPDQKHLLADPQFAELPTGVALASLSQLESEVRAAEFDALKYLAPKVGAKRLLSRLVALSSAESGTVAPGETYRAQLLLGSVFDLRQVATQMRCNGHLISIDSNSIGQVRFQAPLKPGPAFWTGSIRFNINGRDTTFQVRVPYRVARR